MDVANRKLTKLPILEKIILETDFKKSGIMGAQCFKAFESEKTLLEDFSKGKHDKVLKSLKDTQSIKKYTKNKTKRRLLIRAFSKLLENEEYLLEILRIMKEVSIDEHEGTVKHLLPVIKKMDIEALMATKDTRTSDEIYETIFKICNNILCYHKDGMEMSEKLEVLDFVSFILSKFPKYHYKKTEILSNIYVGLQSIGGDALPHSLLQNKSFDCLNQVLGCMNLVLIESIIYVSKKEFHSIELQYRSKTICHIMNGDVCKSLFRLIKKIIFRQTDTSVQPSSSSFSGPNIPAEDEDNEENVIDDSVVKIPTLERRNSGIMHWRQLQDWSERSVLKMYDDLSTVTILMKFDWFECLALIAVTDDSTYKLHALERLYSCSEKFEECNYFCQRFFSRYRINWEKDLFSHIGEYKHEESEPKKEKIGKRIIQIINEKKNFVYFFGRNILHNQSGLNCTVVTHYEKVYTN